MTFRTGKNRPRIHESGRGGFTLIELILVMAVLTIVVSIGAPALSRFFRGRDLDSEARRFLALTRYGQSRAISEGVPMILWFDKNERTYGLKAETTFAEDDPKAKVYNVGEKISIEVEFSADAVQANRTTEFQSEKQSSDSVTTIRFEPDGSISETSPECVMFQEGNDGTLWVAESRNRLNYELQTSQPAYLRR